MDHKVEDLGVILSHNLSLRPLAHNLLTFLAEKVVFFVEKWLFRVFLGCLGPPYGYFFHRISKNLFQTVPNRILTNNNMNLCTIFEKNWFF